MDDLEIRTSLPAEAAGIEDLYAAAFPEENLVPLVRDLLESGTDVLSLICAQGDRIGGHIALTDCAIDGAGWKAALLGPLAVSPDRHRQGIGTRLIQAGFERLRETGTAMVFVLGEPAYYGRFGFAADRSIAPPYPIPDAWAGAWQSVRLGGGVEGLGAGRLSVPRPWRRPELWAV